MFVRLFEKGKRGPGRLAEAARGTGRNGRNPAGTIHRLWRPAATASRTVLACYFSCLKVVKGVYRPVVTLACEWWLPGWFAGDSVGNSGIEHHAQRPGRSVNRPGRSRTS